MSITPNQADQFNRMREALRDIRDDYQTPEKLRKNCMSDFGLDFETALEYAYDNIIETARQAVRGVRPVKNPINK